MKKVQKIKKKNVTLRLIFAFLFIIQNVDDENLSPKLFQNTEMRETERRWCDNKTPPRLSLSPLSRLLSIEYFNKKLRVDVVDILNCESKNCDSCVICVNFFFRTSFVFFSSLVFFCFFLLVSVFASKVTNLTVEEKNNTKTLKTLFSLSRNTLTYARNNNS